jgi:hypothetical protein
MCLGCWEGFGSPMIENEKVLEAIGAVKEVYRHNMAGGGLHGQLDDWNIEDGFFSDESRDKLVAFQEHRDFSEQQRRDELFCFDVMAKLDIKERASVLYFYGYSDREF